MLEFRILGPLEVLANDQPLALRKKQRALLTLLLLRAGEVVSTDELIEELWAGRPPATARDALQNYVSQLRKALGSGVIVTRDLGYLLQAPPEQTDLGRFEKLLGEARGRDAEARAAKLREALGLWRGTPLLDLAYESFIAVESARLEELRAAARADLIDAELELGRHAELAAELEATIAERPFDERPRGQLMLALYRAGRQADALEAYHEARQMLVEELGLEPSAPLRELEQAILKQDASLDLTPQRPTQPLSQRRKMVTVLFADLVDSTALAEQLDPESYRNLLDQYFATARAALERHGGTIEKFIGDAVMAVFGAPRAHEDDALRAVRAAVDLRAGLAELNAELERDRGLRLQTRFGLDTGNVFVSDPAASGALVTGSVVNQAKRLEQAAGAGEIVFGVGTLRLTRDAVTVEEMKLVRIAEETQVTAFRLLELLEGVPPIARYFETPLIGRDEELSLLRQAYAAACEQGRAQLVTIVGEPGVGKTRLSRELVATLEGKAKVLIGRCVAYGEGATFLPLRDMVEQIEGGLSQAVVGDERAELVVRRVAELVGLAEGSGSVEEGFWAVRRLFEALSRDRPLVLVFEDVHWAEPTLLDLVEYLGDRASGSILSVSITRPELLEDRPSWRDASVSLMPLAEQDSEALVASLPGGAELPTELRSRIVAIAEGNPLFAEELLAYVEEHGPSALDDVPPSVEVLLASRLDLLKPDERAVLERAAVVGREFSRDAILALSPSRTDSVVSPNLITLVRHGLIHPTPASPPEELFRFHHVLVRDVAYAGLPKTKRADLHERYADWLEEHADAPDEIVGYHLEQAYRHREQLEPLDEHDLALATRASNKLRLASGRAYAQGDMFASAKLQERAVSLLARQPQRRLEPLIGLARVLYSLDDHARADELTSEVLHAARVAGDTGLELFALMMQTQARARRSGVDQRAFDLAKRSIRVFAELDQQLRLASAYHLLYFCYSQRGQVTKAVHAAEHQIKYTAAKRGERPLHSALAWEAVYGRTPVVEALAICDEQISFATENWLTRAEILGARALLEAMRGSFVEARALIATSRSIVEELGLSAGVRRLRWTSAFDLTAALVELLADDPVAAEGQLRPAWAGTSEWDLQMKLEASSLLAEVLYLQGRYEEAARWADMTAETSIDFSDLYIRSRKVRAKLLARRGEFQEADEFAREAVSLSESTDWLNLRGDALMDLAEVQRLADRPVDAATAAEDALDLYKQKGNVVSARMARAVLEELRTTSSA